MDYREKGKLVSKGRMDTPAFHRNHTHVIDLLKTELLAEGGDVLEIGSGSGQHVLAYAGVFLEHLFWPSDLNMDHIKSIEAWREDEGPANLRAPFQLDVTAADWCMGAPDRPREGLSAIISLNMVHISPIEAAEGLFRGAGINLSAAGKLFLYGPFMKNGEHTAPSNAEFDNWLKNSNPTWGVRDICELEVFAELNGLLLDREASMPSNNFMLIFTSI